MINITFQANNIFFIKWWPSTLKNKQTITDIFSDATIKISFCLKHVFLFKKSTNKKQLEEFFIGNTVF